MNIAMIICIYLTAISLLATLLTLHDKNAARQHKWRVPERTLLLVAALGGSVAMLITMRVIRHKTKGHKTKHAKFMVGIPVMIVLQIAAVGFVLWRYVYG